ncbi:Uncharacterised protein [uncultured archaeon]|nr:Uncharacterised protein [uncultured archaeon]
MQLRKVIHIGGVLIPVVADIIGKTQTLALGFLALIIYLALEFLKPKISKDILSLVYRENELKGFSIEPLSYFFSVLSLLSLSYFIDEILCYAAIAVLAAGDGFAGVIGRRYGKHRFPFNKNKSWEGSLSGFAAALLAGFYFAGPIAIIGSFFGMLAGAINRHDNISVPYAAVLSMLLVRYVLSSG